MQVFKLSLLPLCVSLGLAGCAKGQAADAPDAEQEAEASDQEEQEELEGEEDYEDEEAAEEEEATEEAAKTPESSPLDVLQHEGATFVLNFRNSEMGEKKDAECEKKSGGDPAKKAKCVTAAVEKVGREGIMFYQQTDDQTWWLLRFAIEDDKPVPLNRVQVDFDKPQGTKVTVKTVGPDKAKSPKGSIPNKFVLDVPDEFAITMYDPTRGRVVYDSKVSLFEQVAPK
jgi:hypothetical protein